jgi:hypothetical protein
MENGRSNGYKYKSHSRLRITTRFPMMMMKIDALA